MPPETDWYTGEPWEPPSLPIWQENYPPLMVGPPLSGAIRSEFGLADPNNGLYYCK